VLFSRHLLPAAREQSVLVGLGLRTRERLTPLAAEAAIAAAGAAALAGAVSVALSPLLPYGVGRRAEPDPGFAIDGAALAIGVAVIPGVLTITPTAGAPPALR